MVSEVLDDKTAGVGTIITYLRDELETFAQRPFCEVDSLILTELAYLHFDGLSGVRGDARLHVHNPSLRDFFIAENFPHIFQDPRFIDSDRKLLAVVAASPRFRDVKIIDHVSDTDEGSEMQFSATTYRLPDGTLYIAYRGTDLSLVGWKEDFELGIKRTIPAQAAALRYFERIAMCFPGDIRVGGHSKGGNLAVYAGVMCDGRVARRILKIYSHDGPGFRPDTLDSKRLAKMMPLISKTVPEMSVIGMILEQNIQHRVVKCNSFGIMQHSPYNWRIKDDGFITAEGLSPTSIYLHDTFSTWIDGLDDEQAATFVDALFGQFEAMGKKDNMIFTPSDIGKAAVALRDMDPEMREVLLKTLSELIGASFKSLSPGKPEDREDQESLRPARA